MKKQYRAGDRLNIGVIGCGQIAQMMHLHYLTENENFNLYSICDLSRNVLDHVGDRYHLPGERRFLRMDDLLADENLDAVVISTKNHYEAGVKAARAGKHLFIEKPFCYNAAQCEEIIALAREKGLVLQVGYMKRHDPNFQYALDKIRTMKDIHLVRVHDYGGSFDFTTGIFTLYDNADVPAAVLEADAADMDRAKLAEIGDERKELLRSYDLICGLSSHDTILMRHAFGAPRVRYAQVPKPGFVTAVLELPGGVQCVFESGLVMNRRAWDESLWVYSGACNLDVHFPWPYLKNAPTTVHINENEGDTMVNVDKRVNCSFDEAYRCEWRHFYGCVVEGRTPVTSGEDAMRDIQLAGDIIRAVQL